jgi:hypothetical protein
MLNATVAADSIVLPAGAAWPDLCDSRVLYVRNFYAALWETVLDRGFTYTAAIILGTPGSELEAMPAVEPLPQALVDACT